MESLEEMLSPIVTNFNSIDTSTDVENNTVLIEKINKQKKDVIEKRISPSQANLVRPEIVASWLRSLENGLDPWDFILPPVMDHDDFEARLKEKEHLVHASKPYICQLENMLSSTEFYIFLSDEQGVILYVVEALTANKYHLVPGSIWNEETTGTCSHAMCIRLRSPIQVCGPEHFNRIFSKIWCSSAPIYDVNGKIEGTLTIACQYPHCQNSQSLALVVSIAWAIQKDFQLSENNGLLNAAIESNTGAMILINKNGVITASNATANAMFESSKKNLVGSHIDDILGNQPAIESVLETGEPIINMDLQIKKRQQKIHLDSALPIKNKNEGCILTIRGIDQIVKIVKPSSGSATRFTFDRIIGSSQKSMNSINLAKKFARFNNNILIQGESGTGKEVFAQAIHNESRPNGPFIALNCAAIPKDLIESELFGYEAGAFTGAERQGKIGKFELASGGTLFLDEIGDMPLELQPVLLRVLEDKMITHVGGSRYIPVDFKLVTATNKNLLELIKNNQFREDLYYRISVFNIVIPTLRDRGSDIIEMAEHFIHTTALAYGLSKPILSNATKYILLEYDWPGNVRQLQNAMLYAVCMCSEGIIRPDNLPVDIINISAASSNPEQMQMELIVDSTSADSNLSMKDIEKMVIKKALEDSNSNIRLAAKILGISKSTLYRKIKEYELLEIELRTS